MSKRHIDKQLQYFFARGWAPASYKHLRPELRQLIRDIRFRPGIKECFQNSQRLIVAARDTEIGSRLEYHEGLLLSLGLPIMHAWLSLDGEIQDPTVCDKLPDDYIASNTYPEAVVRNNMLETQHYCSVDPAALQGLLMALFDKGLSRQG